MRIFCAFIASCMMSLSVSALAKDVRAKGDVPYEAGLFSSEPGAQVKQKAVSVAVANAWKRYTSEFTTAKLNAYKKIQGYFDNNLDEFVIDKAVIEQALDKDANVFSVVVKVSFNDVAVDPKLNEGNAKSGAVGGSKSLFAFLFLAREQDSIKSFDARRTEIVSNTDSEDASESTKLHSAGGRVSTSRETTSKKVSGGSTLRKSDQI